MAEDENRKKTQGKILGDLRARESFRIANFARANTRVRLRVIEEGNAFEINHRGEPTRERAFEHGDLRIRAVPFFVAFFEAHKAQKEIDRAKTERGEEAKRDGLPDGIERDVVEDGESHGRDDGDEKISGKFTHRFPPFVRDPRRRSRVPCTGLRASRVSRL